MIRTAISIPGIHCSACAALIEDVSREFAAINNVDVNIRSKIVTLTHGENLDIKQWSHDVESLDPRYKISSRTL